MEQSVQFGHEHSLSGILGLPESASGPALLLSNAGTLTRTGPNRLWVQLARAATERGWPTLRFDQTGFGDSPVSDVARTINERRLDEYNDAIDFITRETDATSVIIVGLCSGAIDAHDVAVVDSRVKASMMVDGYADRTRGFHRRRILDYVRSPRRWKSAPNCARPWVSMIPLSFNMRVSWPTMLLMGSPTKRNSPKAMRPTVSMTTIDCRTRRITNAIMTKYYVVFGKPKTGREWIPTRLHIIARSDRDSDHLFTTA